MYLPKQINKSRSSSVIEDFEGLKKILDGRIKRIPFIDESMIRDYQVIYQTWFERGKQRFIKTFGKHREVNWSDLNYETGEVYCEEHDTYDAKVFLGFLRNTLSRNEGGNTIIILDNVQIHHAKLFKPFLKENEDKLQLMFLPPYSLDLNLIKGLWKWLKEKVFYNVFYKTLTEIKNNVNAFLGVISADPEAVIQRLCFKL